MSISKDTKSLKRYDSYFISAPESISYSREDVDYLVMT